jgi:hypothetical protein
VRFVFSVRGVALFSPHKALAYPTPSWRAWRSLRESIFDAAEIACVAGNNYPLPSFLGHSPTNAGANSLPNLYIRFTQPLTPSLILKSIETYQ